jgi:hypothetical protein
MRHITHCYYTMPFIHPAVWKPGCVTEGLDLRPIITQCFPLATSFRAISPLTAARGWQAITKPRFCSRGSTRATASRPRITRPCHSSSPQRRNGSGAWECPRTSESAASRPRRRHRRRGERRKGGDAWASPGTDSVGRRGWFRPHHGGGRRRRRAGGFANRGRADVAARRGRGQRVGHTPSKTSRLQPAPLIGGDDRSSSPRQDGILTLKSFMIPHVIGRLTAQVDWL